MWVFFIKLLSMIFHILLLLKKPHVNPSWHELWKKEKCSSLAPPMSKFYKTQWARRVSLSQLISIFTSKNVWKFLVKIQLTKFNQKIIRGVNLPCLMPISVKSSCSRHMLSKLFFSALANSNSFSFLLLSNGGNFVLMFGEKNSIKKGLS